MLLNFSGIILTVLLLCYIRTSSSWDFNIKLPKFNSYNPYCYKWECCNDGWIKFDKRGLVRNLAVRVYGQPLLSSAIDAISTHFNPHFPSTKALTLSFHGMTGTGKNFVSKFLTESIYREGTRSKYVHHFIGRLHFAERSKVNEYKNNLYSWLKGNASKCARQLFIFDETDKMIPEVLNSIKPLIDFRDHVEGVDFSKSIFIFLSNTGTDIINDHYHNLHINWGKRREELNLSDFETLIQQEAFNEQGGFHHSDTIKSNLIDHYIPFLPLEEKHVRLCVKAEFAIRHVLEPKKQHIDEIMNFVEFGPDHSKIFAKTGCKRIAQKVAILIEKHYRHLYSDRDEL